MSDKIHVILGSDEGLVAEQALRLFNKLKPAGDDEFANDLIEGNADNAESAFQICGQVIQSLQTMSFFSTQKVVWLKAANFLGSDRTSEAERTKEGVQSIISVLESGLSDDTTFIISASAIDKRRALYKFLNAYAKISVYDKIDTSGRSGQVMLADSIRSSADELGFTFSRAALNIFVQLVGVDTRQIRSELQKLDLYLGKDRRVVEIEDVELIVPLTRAGVVFEIGRALQNRNGIRALKLVDEQLQSGESAIAIIRASLIPTIRNLFMAKLVVEHLSPPLDNYNSFKAMLDKFPEQDLAWLPSNKSGAISLYPIFLTAGDARKFSLSSLRDAMMAAHDIDRKLVTTGLDHRVLLHKLIVELCSSKKPSH